MPGQPITDADFVARKQGFEAVAPGVGVLDHDAAAVELGVEGGVVVGLPVGGAAVAGDVGRDVAPGAFPAKVVSKALSAFRNSPATGMLAASRNAQISPNKSLSK